MEGMEKFRTFVGNAMDKVRKANRALGQINGSEAVFPLKIRQDQRPRGYLERANDVLDGDGDEIRYKVITLGELDKSKRRHFVGKRGEEHWNDGERVLAFEDGTVVFKESGSEFWGALDYPDEAARWIAFLENLPERWESGPSSKIEAVQFH